ncbi:hypothetical protein DPM33_00145 [Mesorhizobium hawassense]|uniref:Uncharacterized protein n=1 Tax=Mesorhizobium hawassense TaxID=1209954 RepID=A0A330HUM6_9HYPH|nr:hypothetical protein DPM33_00145 [Mesorhizobium hawassense]
MTSSHSTTNTEGRRTRPLLSDVALAAAMLLIILFRPQGITGGHELELPRDKKPISGLEASTKNTGISHV